MIKMFVDTPDPPEPDPPVPWPPVALIPDEAVLLAVFVAGDDWETWI